LFRTHPRSKQLIAKARKLGAFATAVVYPCSADSPANRIVLAAVACLRAHQHKETRA